MWSWCFAFVVLGFGPCERFWRDSIILILRLNPLSVFANVEKTIECGLLQLKAFKGVWSGLLF